MLVLVLLAASELNLDGGDTHGHTGEIRFSAGGGNVSVTLNQEATALSVSGELIAEDLHLTSSDMSLSAALTALASMNASLTALSSEFATLQNEVATLRQLARVITPPPASPPPVRPPPAPPPPPATPPASPLPEGCAKSISTNEIICDTGKGLLRLMVDWRVPTGVTTLTAKGWGAGGLSGNDHHAGDGYQYPAGGGGGAFAGTLATTPGEMLTLGINLYCPPYDPSCGSPFDGGRGYAGSGYTAIFRQVGATPDYVPLVLAAGGGSGTQNGHSSGTPGSGTDSGTSSSASPHLTGAGGDYPVYNGGAGLPGGAAGAYYSASGGGGTNYLAASDAGSMTLYSGGGTDPGNSADPDRDGAGVGGSSTEPPSGGGSCGRCNIADPPSCDRKDANDVCICGLCVWFEGWGLRGGRLVLRW